MKNICIPGFDILHCINSVLHESSDLEWIGFEIVLTQACLQAQPEGHVNWINVPNGRIYNYASKKKKGSLKEKKKTKPKHIPLKLIWDKFKFISPKEKHGLAYSKLGVKWSSSSPPQPFGTYEGLSPLHNTEPAEKQPSESIISRPPFAGDWGAEEPQNYQIWRVMLISTNKSFPTNRCFSKDISQLPFWVFV